MTSVDTNPILEVRHSREVLLKKYGGIVGLHQHMDTEREKLEAQGWQFVSAEEIRANRRRMQELKA